jgi:hypothetical protein
MVVRPITGAPGPPVRQTRGLTPQAWHCLTFTGWVAARALTAELTVMFGAACGCFRLAADGQIWKTNVCGRRNLPFVVLRGD